MRSRTTPFGKPSPENQRRDRRFPTVTVVVCTRNRPKHLDECLRHLAASDYPPFEVLIIDNAPSDNASREVALGWGARYEVEPEPGLTRARNRAARLVESEVIAFLDDDALAAPDWLREITSSFEQESVVAVAGRVVPWSSSDEHRGASSGRGTSNSGTVGGADRVAFSQNTDDWFLNAAFGGVGIGANMAFRRDAFTVGPGFDERLGPGGLLHAGEEYQAWVELIRRGKTVVYTPAAVVRHPYDPDTGGEIRRRYIRSYFGVGCYTAYLLAEYPAHAAKTLRYAFRRLAGGPNMRNDTKITRPEGVTRFSVLRAFCSGVLTYVFRGRSVVPMRKRRSLLAS